MTKQQKTRFFAIFMLLLAVMTTYQPVSGESVQVLTQRTQIIITADNVNVRVGPSTSFPSIGKVNKNDVLDSFGKMGKWYVVRVEGNKTGFVHSDFAKPYSSGAPKPTAVPQVPSATAKPTVAPTPTKPPATPKPTAAPTKPPATPRPTTAPTAPPATPKPTIAPTAPPATSAPAPSTGLTADEQEMLNLINAERAKNGLPAYVADMELTKVARLKSQDMVNNNYFSHQSPTYGSPFDMMKQFGITYKSAGENIAANSTVAGAHASLMNSAGHRANILSSSFNRIGIGIVPSPRYGKMFTQMFIQK